MLTVQYGINPSIDVVGWAWLQDALAGSLVDEVVMGSSEGLLCMARAVHRLLEVASDCKEKLAANNQEASAPASVSGHRPSRCPSTQDTIISNFCGAVFILTLLLLYLFPLPS